ncbi:stage II sporulation protein M [Chloroflexota bacterium]
MRYRWWFVIAGGLFLTGMLLGLLVPIGAVGDVLSENLAVLEELGATLAPFQATTAIFIFFKNTFALLFSFVFSPILCLMPVLALLANGGLLSLVSVIVIEEESLGLLLAGILPHGVLEIPALIIGEAAALSFGAMVVMLLVRKESRTVLVSVVKQRILLAFVIFIITGIFPTIIVLALLREQTRAIFLPNLKQNLKFLGIAIALLVPAAIIETFVTPLLLQ